MDDTIEIEILEDGTLKMSTDKISGANHGTAEAMIREIIAMAGGAVSSKMKPGAKAHSHNFNGKTIRHSH